MDKTYKININSDTKNLKIVADFLEKSLKGNEKPIMLDEILVAVDEAVTNIIKHAYKNKRGGNIRLVMNLRDDRLVISIFDKGSVFDPIKVPAPDLSQKLDGRSVGGLGVFLMKKFMDKVTFYFKEKGGRVENEVRMIKYIK